MKKRLLILPILAGFVLSGCDFDFQKLMFWKKNESQQQQPDDKKEEEKVPTVVSVAVSAPVSSVFVGDDPVQFSATVTVENGAAQTVAWSSSNSAVATVSSSGVVTPVGPGTAVITATSTVDASKFGSASLSVATPKVVSVSISGFTGPAYLGQESVQLTGTIVAEGKLSKEGIWASSNANVASVSSSGLLSFVGEGSAEISFTSVADSSKKATLAVEVTAPHVVSATISGYTGPVYFGQADVQLTGTIVAQGDLSTEGVWASSDENVASVSEAGLLSFVGIGTAEISFTSVVDESIKDVLSVEVKDGGLYPELITEYGFSFSRLWPDSEVDTFAAFDIFSLEDENGFYYAEIPAEEATETSAATPACFEIVGIYSESLFNDLMKAFEDGEYFYYENSYYESPCFIDQTQKVEIDVNFVPMDEEEKELVIVMDVYRCEDKWKSSTPTSDTEWEEETAKELASLGVDLPFIALGENYDVYVYEDGMVEISDYCADFRKLDSYGDVLAGAEFVLGEDGVYRKQIDAYHYAAVNFLFNEYGNSIQVWRSLVELDEFPEALASFVGEGGIGSKYSVPAFEGEGLKYTFDTYEIALDEEETDVRDAAEVTIYGVDEEACVSYVSGLKEDGYVEVGSIEQNYGSSAVILQKGKIVIQASINYLSRPATAEEIAAIQAITEEDLAAMTEEEYNDYFLKVLELAFTGTFTVYDYSVVDSASLLIYGDPEGIEDPGLYIVPSSASIDIEDTYKIEPLFFEIEESAVSYVSSNPEVATVDANGVVTGVAYGEAVITATIQHAELGELSDTLAVTVEDKVSIEEVAGKINAILASHQIADQLVLPKMDNFEFIELDDSYFEESAGFIVNCNTSESEESYCEKLEGIGYEISLDEYGYPIASNGIFLIEPYYDDEEGYFQLYITYLGGSAQAEEFEDKVTFSTLGFSNAEEVEVIALEHATIEFDKGSGSVTPKYYDTGTGIRTYGGNTITVSVDGELNSIVFAFSQDNKDITANCGSWDHDTLTWTAGDESISSVTFTVASGSGHNRITGMTIVGYGSAGGGGGGGGDTDNVAYQIMYDVGVAGWGYVEDGDFKDPDSDGIIQSNYSIGWDDVESPEDSETCLNGVLNEFLSDADFPSYLTVVEDPSYTANAIEGSIGVSEVYLVTSDYEYVLYMYDYCYDGEVTIVFMAGPYDAFFEA